jgi:GTP cyclohydrolase I
MNATMHCLRQGAHGTEAAAPVPSRSELDALIGAASTKIAELVDALRIGRRATHNTREKPQRAAKMFVAEIFRSRYGLPPIIAELENAGEFDSFMVAGPIGLRSKCAHHSMPVCDRGFFGMLPAATGKMAGLSKCRRIIDYFAPRFQMQAELAKRIGHYIIKATAPRRLAIRSAVHMCKTQRGVRRDHSSRMVSTAYYGASTADEDLTLQFLQECFALERCSQP